MTGVQTCALPISSFPSHDTTLFTYPTAVTTFSSASGGGDKESLTSIKYFAPKSIQTQERAITARDYETMLRKEFGSSVIKSVSVYGGDEMDPPRYGKVAISINPYEGTTISDGFKTASEVCSLVILVLTASVPAFLLA